MGLFLGLLTNVIGGTSFVLGKLALEGWPPATLVVLRLALCLPILALTVPRGWRAKATRADWARLGVIGVVGLAAPHLIGLYGLQDAESMSGAILVGLEPVGILVLARVLLGERLRPTQLAGIGFALAGAVLVVSRGDLRSIFTFTASTRGSLLLALHSLLWAVYTVAAKPTLVRVPASALTLVTTVIALVLIAPFSLIELSAIDPARAFAPRALLAAIGLGLGVSWLATILWNRALMHLRASEMAVLVFVQPVTGMLLSALLGEALPGGTALGAALVFVGVWLTRERAPAPIPTT